MIVQQYLEGVERQGRTQAREALRWWYRAARRSDGANGPNEAGGHAPPTGPVPARSNTEAGTNRPAMREPARSRPRTPPLARNDLWSSDWEAALIRASRERGFLFRTETTYREWAARFAAFLQPRSPLTATKEDVGALLSKLAVELRASPSTPSSSPRQPPLSTTRTFLLRARSTGIRAVPKGHENVRSPDASARHPPLRPIRRGPLLTPCRIGLHRLDGSYVQNPRSGRQRIWSRCG